MQVNVPLDNKKITIEIPQTNLLINGKFQPSQSGKTFDVINPTTEQIITEVALADDEDVELAVNAAQNALKGPWGNMGARERAGILYRLADLIDANTDNLANLEVLNNGKPINEAKGYDIPSAAATIRYFAGCADKIEGKTIPISRDFLTYTLKEPVGVCGLIIPWNFPVAMAAWKLGPCLAAGCSAILKPAEQTPLSALAIGELALQAGLPEGVLNIVTGFGEKSTGEALVTHPGVDKIAFTGEASTAVAIKRATADTCKRLSFELGGKSPNIIFADANIDQAIDGALSASFLNQGQNCCAGSRTFIHEKIYDQYVDKFAKAAAQRNIGNPFSEKTEHGSQIDKNQFDKIMKYIDIGMTEGAECITGGERHGDLGYYIKPTVFAHVTNDMVIAREEIFGPVATCIRFRDINEVIQQANDTPFGLAGAVWTNDLDTAHHVAAAVRTGTMWINCYNIIDPAAPFGGFKHSGSGRELGEQALDLYTENKTITMATRIERATFS